MKRAFIIASALSLLLAGVTALAWWEVSESYIAIEFHLVGRAVWRLGSSKYLGITLVRYSQWPEPVPYHFKYLTGSYPTPQSHPATYGPMIANRNHGAYRDEWWHQSGLYLAYGKAAVWLTDEGAVDYHVTPDKIHKMSQARFSAPFGFWEVRTPHWMVLSLFSLLPLTWPVLISMRIVRRGIRKRQGRCLSCGYDVRAALGRCPECGAPVQE